MKWVTQLRLERGDRPSNAKKKVKADGPSKRISNSTKRGKTLTRTGGEPEQYMSTADLSNKEVRGSRHVIEKARRPDLRLEKYDTTGGVFSQLSGSYRGKRKTASFVDTIVTAFVTIGDGPRKL